MGWGNGISIGWPNASAQATPPTVYTINLYGCTLGPPFATYSSSPTFAVGVYLYIDTELTIPVNAVAGPSVGNPQYVITEGLITPGTIACPL